MGAPLISVDWGTSRCRIRLVDADGRVLAEDDRAPGCHAVAGEAEAGARAQRFERVLRERLAALCAAAGREPGGTVAISGMASSSFGWRELPYAGLPFALDGEGLALERFACAPWEIVLVSGVRAECDVMRGEETQLVGLFAGEAHAGLRARCTVLLPGTHSKHVQVRDGAVRDFATHLTGELYEMLRRHSVLRASTGDGEFDGDAFRDGVIAGRTALTAALFRVRPAQLLHGRSPAEGAWFLSGALIGGELCGLLDGDEPILLCAPPTLARIYHVAAGTLGLGDRTHLVTPDRARAAVALGHRAILARWAAGAS